MKFIVLEGSGISADVSYYEAASREDVIRFLLDGVICYSMSELVAEMPQYVERFAGREELSNKEIINSLSDDEINELFHHHFTGNEGAQEGTHASDWQTVYVKQYNPPVFKRISSTQVMKMPDVPELYTGLGNRTGNYN